MTSRLLSLAGAVFCFAVAMTPSPATAQTDNDSLDREARSVFEAAETAFGDGRYADALGYFRRAYELSHRPELLYNIGIAADRLRSDEEALSAYERFLEEVPDHTRRHEVESRVAAIRAALAARATDDQANGSDTEPTEAGEASASTESGGGAWIIAPIAIGAAGLAGVVAAVIGMAAGSGCVDMGAGGVCVEERATNWAAVGVYAGLGIAAIVGAVVWLLVGLGGDDDEPGVALLPNGLAWRL